MNSPDKLRLFIAVTIPETVREDIARLLRELDGKLPGIRWTPAANLHLTLKFLGDVEAARVPEIGRCLDRTAVRHLPLTVRLEGLGRFPPRGRPQVIWAGVEEGRRALTELAGGLDRGLAELGFPPEARPYTPHLTLGRLKSGRRLPDPRVWERELGRKRDSLGSFTAAVIILMKSTLAPRGAIHQELTRHGTGAGKVSPR